MLDANTFPTIDEYLRERLMPARAIYHTMMNTVIGDQAVVDMILEFKEAYQARATA